MNISEQLREDLIASDAKTLKRAAQDPDSEKLRVYIAAVRSIPLPTMSSGDAHLVALDLAAEIHCAFDHALEAMK